MRFEDIISKISKLAAIIIVYFICAGFYLNSKGFIMQPDGSISLVKNANASVEQGVFASPINNNTALSLPSKATIGSQDAPITIYEFSSLSCSHCADFHLSTIPLLQKQFIDNGKVKFIFVNFPLEKKSMRAGMLSECINDDSRNDFIKTMFKKQREWLLSHNTDKVLIKYAKLYGMTEEEASACLSNDNLAKDMLEIRQQGLDRLGIKGTPAFLVDYKGSKEIIYGAPNYQTLKNYLETKLSK